eukprot:9481859-Pyramimonas_sp.AAC.1
MGSVVPVADNYFTALNSAVFSDGSFCYIPKGVTCPMELSTYFRINAKETGQCLGRCDGVSLSGNVCFSEQFERTLIVAEDDSYVSYLEGCTAPAYDKNQVRDFSTNVMSYSNVKRLTTLRSLAISGIAKVGCEAISYAANPTMLDAVVSRFVARRELTLTALDSRASKTPGDQAERVLLHAAVVELYTGKNAEIKYSTVQNWYSGDENGLGGIYNFVTKRGLCKGDNSKISWTQVTFSPARASRATPDELFPEHSFVEYESLSKRVVSGGLLPFMYP